MSKEEEAETSDTEDGPSAETTDRSGLESSPDGGEDGTKTTQEPVDEDRDPTGSDGDAGRSGGLAADEQYCTSCGSVVKKQAEICPDCGVRIRDPPASEKNAGLAAVLSFLVTGLGQIYNGQVGKGIGLIVVQFINFLLMFVVIGLVTFPIVWLYGIYDAYVTAERINDGEISS